MSKDPSGAADKAALQNFEKTVAAFDTHLMHGELAQAAILLETARNLSQAPQRKELLERYAQLVLVTGVQIQCTALHCGNILPQHLHGMRFALACSRKMHSLASAEHNGLAEIISTVLIKNARLGILVCSEHSERNLPGLTSAAELDQLLNCAAALSEESRSLASRHSAMDDRPIRLQAARDAASNALYCIPRWFFAPDYQKAEVFCRHAEALLQQKAAGEKQDESIATAIETFGSCAEVLESGDKKRSREALSKMLKLLPVHN